MEAMQGEVSRQKRNFSKVFIAIVNSPQHLVWMGFTILIVSATLFKLFEHVGIVNASYWSVITALGVGYGDVTPHHVGGKCVAAGLAIVTILFFIPMIVASIASRLIVDRNAFTNAEQEETQHNIRSILDHLGIERDKELEAEADS